MPIDGFFIHHLVKEIKPTVEKALIGKIYQPSKNEIVFQIRNNFKNYSLYFNIDLENPRVYISNLKFSNPKIPFNFCMLLRKYLERGIIENIEQISNDRIICLKIISYNEMEDSSSFNLYFELTGRSSNLILTNEDNIILDSIRKYPPSDTNTRFIIPKAKYILPKSNKINPFVAKEDTFFYDLEGVSKDLQKEFNLHNSFKEVINKETKPTIFEGKKASFYCIDLDSKEGKKTYFDSLSSMFDTYFSKNEITINEEALKLSKQVKKEIDKRKKKLLKFDEELNDARSQIENKDYGILLQSYLYLIKKGDESITVKNFLDNNKEVTIKLDPLKDGVENLNIFFKKNKKAEHAVIEITNQINITKEEIDYLENIYYQLQFLNYQEVEEVKNELINYKFIFTKHKSTKAKKNKINLLCYNIDGIDILIGKNNIQNNYLTNKVAKPNDVWFHVKDLPGSHVVVKTNELNEKLIRFAANLAASFSKGATSSSVPVDYTEVRYIKKIPGVKGYKVTYTNNKTIYIDPDPKMYDSLKTTYR